MSVIDDVRVLLQDIVAPDLKAIAARLDALEVSVKQGFDISERSMSQRFDAAERIAAIRHEAILSRFDGAIASANANHEATLKAMNMDRRMEQLEALVAAQARESARGERHAKSS
jgi:hypothetical protein